MNSIRFVRTVSTRPVLTLSMALILATGCGSSSANGDGGDPASDAATRTDLGTDTAGALGGGAGTGGSGLGGAGGAILPGGTGGAILMSDAGATDAPVGPVPTTAQDLCRSFCDRVTKCDTTRDQQTCLNACTNSNAALFPKLRPEVVASIAACVAQKDCAMISQDVSLKTCATEAAAIIGPSAAATALCAALDAAQTQCGVTIDKADCLTTVKIYGDSILTQAMACAPKSCSLIYACASATLNPAIGSWSLGGGIKPGKKCAGMANPCSYFSSTSQMAQCQSAGCTYAATCTGTPSCFYGSTMATCQAITGCTWSGTTCSGVSTLQCATQATATACQLLGGCFSSANCTGTVPLCSTRGVAACQNQPGCMVQEAI